MAFWIPRSGTGKVDANPVDQPGVHGRIQHTSRKALLTVLSQGDSLSDGNGCPAHSCRLNPAMDRAIQNLLSGSPAVNFPAAH